MQVSSALKLRLLWTIIVLLAATLSIGYLLHNSAREDPVKNGRRLSEWLKDIPPGFVSGSSVYRRITPYLQTHPAAQKAIRDLGTNCFPLLRRYLELSRRPFHDTRIVQWLLKVLGQKPQSHIDQYRMALGALVDLREIAVPLLVELYTEVNSPPATRRFALVQLSSYAGPDLLPFLCKVAVQSFQANGDTFALQAIEKMDPSGTAFLLSRLNSRKAIDRCEAATKLAESPVLPDLAIPFLMAAQSDENSHVREAVAAALAAYKTNGSPNPVRSVYAKVPADDNLIMTALLPPEFLSPPKASSLNNSNPPPCLRPSGTCPEQHHGLHCAILRDPKAIWPGPWEMQNVYESESQTLEIRKLIRQGWWLSRPSMTPDGRIVGQVMLLKPMP